MKYAVIYSNATGNTKLLADCVSETLPKENCIYNGVPSQEALSADRIYVGFWTDQGTADKTAAAFLKTLQNKEIFLFGSAGFGGSEAYFEEILNATRENIDASNRVIGTFMCQGKMPFSVRERYMDMKARKVDNPNLDMLIANFDEALSHPDEKDMAHLKSAVETAV